MQEVTDKLEARHNRGFGITNIFYFIEILYLNVLDLLNGSIEGWERYTKLRIRIVLNGLHFSFLL